jgi:hypothetical protein
MVLVSMALKAPTFPVPVAAESPTEVLLLVQANVLPMELVKTSATVLVPAQTDWLVGVTVMIGVGVTENAKVVGVPRQPFAVGVTTIVLTIGNSVAFAPVVNGPYMPVAEVVPDAKPVVVLLLVYVNVAVAEAALVKVSITEVAGQLLWKPVLEVMDATVGVGFTVMVKEDDEEPAQLPAVGVTVIVAMLGVLALVFRPVKEAILPDPEAPKPIEVLLFVQL